MAKNERKARGSDRVRDLEKLQRKIQDLMDTADELEAPEVKGALSQALIAANDAWSDAVREDADESGSDFQSGRGVYERSKLHDSRPLAAKTGGAHSVYR